MRIGKYKMDTKHKEVAYVYLPESVMMQSTFNFDDVFQALNIETPQLIFQVNKGNCIKPYIKNIIFLYSGGCN